MFQIRQDTYSKYVCSMMFLSCKNCMLSCQIHCNKHVQHLPLAINNDPSYLFHFLLMYNNVCMYLFQLKENNIVSRNQCKFYLINTGNREKWTNQECFINWLTVWSLKGKFWYKYLLKFFGEFKVEFFGWFPQFLIICKLLFCAG